MQKHMESFWSSMLTVYLLFTPMTASISPKTLSLNTTRRIRVPVLPRQPDHSRSNTKMLKKLLLLSASAGAGHIRAAQALEKAFNQLEPALEVRHLDVLDYTNKLFRHL